MTCQFKSFGSIVDVEKVKTCLFHQDANSSEEGEDDAWNWSIDDDTNSNENWLEECLLSLSPSSELLILAHQRNLAILGAKWDTNEEGEEKIKYYLNWHGDLCSEPSEKIASTLCLPISAQGRSHCGADWTAIAVGFTSGALRFYTEKGSLLLSEILHDEPIVRLKCHTSAGSNNVTEELYVLYQTVVASIQGFVLCNTLRACRNQLARVEARCGDKVEAPPLALIKWSLSEQEKVHDVCVLGLGSTTGLAHLVTASIRGGYYAYYRATPPQISTVIGVGTRPYVGFHIIMEGAAPPVLSDVAKAVATKVKSAFGQVVPGWLGRGRRPSSNEKTKEKGALEPAETMSCRFGICDMIREGERIYESPDRSLSAVCDTLGRVVLVDNSSGLAIRMWKGYRSAQCGFIQIEESEKRGTGRRALVLAIYAPKKGLVEVWALQQGPKLATLPATKNGILFYVNYGLLGVNSSSSKSANLSHHPCVFLTSSGLISHVSVPFHSILSKSNPRSRDQHILKQVKRALSKKETTDVIELCRQLSTAKAKKLALEAAIQSSGITSDTLTAIIDHFSQQSTSEEPSDGGESCEEAEALERTISNLRCLLDLYEITVKLQDRPPEYSTVVASSPESNENSSVLWTLLQLTPAESEKVVTFISDAEAVHPREKSVKFSQTLNVYLSAFVSSLSTSPPLTISKEVSNSDLAAIGELLCSCVLYGSCTVEAWKCAASDTNIQPRSLFFIALSYWLVKPHGQNVHSEMILFHRLLSAILSLVSDLKETVQWWSVVRTNILESKKITNAMTAALITRSLYLAIEQRFSDVENDWEQVSDESFTWSQLISQVEAGATLQMILNHKPPDKLSHEPIPRLEYSPPDFTLSCIINRGPGMVCECVSKWCCAWGLRPEWLEAAISRHQTSPDKEDPQLTSVVNGIAPGTQPSSEAWETTTRQGEVLELISGLRQHFPYTLSPGALLAGQSWEYGSAWAHAPDQTVYLSVCLSALAKISSPHLRQGLCSITWNVHLKNKFESTVRLLHKVGKLPKEKLCRQEINMSDTTVNIFLKYLITFFNLFIESAYEAESNSEMSKVKREPLWAEGSQHSLAEVCLAQAPPSPPILSVQLTAARLLYLLSGLPVRLNRPITSLLDSLSESYLWSDIRKRVQQPPPPSEDPRLSAARLSFLTSVITAAVEPLAQQGEEGLADSVKWMTQVFTLANEWSLSLDPLRLHQVCRYYLVGCDRYAEEVVNAVNDKERLGHHLLLIVGQRMKTILGSTENRAEMKESLANLSPSLASWIQDQEELKAACNLQDTFILLERVIHLLREGSTSDYRFAVLLYEAIEPLIKV